MTVSVGDTVQLRFDGTPRGILISGPRMVAQSVSSDGTVFCVTPGISGGSGFYAGTYKDGEVVVVDNAIPDGMVEALQEIRSQIDPAGPYAVEIYTVPAVGNWQFIIYQKHNPQSVLDGFLFGTPLADPTFIARIVQNLTELF
jgi:hypothetical protein